MPDHTIRARGTSPSILIPAFDGNILFAHFAKCQDKSAGQPGIGYQRDIVVHRGPPDQIIVVQLIFGQILGDIDDQVDLFILQIINGIGALLFIGPGQNRGIYAAL
jgi:hypothetical protein